MAVLRMVFYSLEMWFIQYAVECMEVEQKKWLSKGRLISRSSFLCILLNRCIFKWIDFKDWPKVSVNCSHYYLISLFSPTWKGLNSVTVPQGTFILAGTQVRHIYILQPSIHSVSLQTWNNSTYILLAANFIVLPAFKHLFLLWLEAKEIASRKTSTTFD